VTGYLTDSIVETDIYRRVTQTSVSGAVWFRVVSEELPLCLQAATTLQCGLTTKLRGAALFAESPLQRFVERSRYAELMGNG
jgi:hypothetical protein